jgi:biopolymer transport protein TolQ
MSSILSRWTITSILLASGWMGRSIVLILFVLSVFLFAILLKKLKEFKKIEKENERFWDEFYNNNKEIPKEILNLSPLGRIFSEIIGKSRIVKETIERVKNKEIEIITSYLSFVATTVTISPFLGLLGTVWGIMVAFIEIKNYGTAHINIVAPGIAEALITTAIGLCVAIPAVIIYNYLTSRANKLIEELNLFTEKIVAESKQKEKE